MYAVGGAFQGGENRSLGSFRPAGDEKIDLGEMSQNGPILTPHPGPRIWWEKQKTEQKKK